MKIIIPLLGFVLLGFIIFMQHRDIIDLKDRIDHRRDIEIALRRRIVILEERIGELSSMLHCAKKQLTTKHDVDKTESNS